MSSSDDGKWNLSPSPPPPPPDDPSNVTISTFLFGTRDDDSLEARLEEFLREQMKKDDTVDGKDEMEKVLQRTRKDWEDIQLSSMKAGCHFWLGMASGLLGNQGFQRFLRDQERQEKMRRFFVSTKVRTL